MKLISVLVLIALIVTSGCEVPEKNVSGEKEMLKNILAKFVPTEIKYDTTLINDRQKKVVENLYFASKVMDEIFLRQVYSKNEEIQHLLSNPADEVDSLKLQLFNIMFGPFNRLDHDKPFIGNEEKPAGANFYPEDMTKEEFSEWLKNHPEDENSFTSEFTIIRRENGNLVAIPYNIAYKDKLSEAARYLREAAKYSDNQSLKKYLQLRADAFETNDYFESDMAWMDLKDNLIEIVIGPYEVYEDALFNYKAAFESFLTIKDPEESSKLAKFASYLDEMEANLPIEEKYKNKRRGSESPIVVANEIFSAGDTKAGVQTLAFNLPNDERVREAKGSKKVMLKNVHEAKFEKLLKPIAEIVLDPEQMDYVTFDGFFNHTLMHEMSHGVGPGVITVNGVETEVKKELKETYSTLEECKADILGMYNNMLMIKKGIYPAEFEKGMWVTFLAGTFRSVRFGINEAHGGGNAIIYNYLLEKGAYIFDPETEKVKVNFEKVYPALEELANLVLMIQAKGDYAAAKKLISEYAVNSESMELLRNKLEELPVDIKPVFQIEQHLNNK